MALPFFPKRLSIIDCNLVYETKRTKTTLVGREAVTKL